MILLTLALTAFSALGSPPQQGVEVFLISKGYTSKKASTLKKAYAHLQKEKYSQAISLCSSLRTDPLFGDYAAWIRGTASKELAKTYLKRKNFGLAQKTANDALVSFFDIEKKNPYSPFLKRHSKDAADSELLLAMAHWGRKQWQKSEEVYERAFQRLAASNRLFYVPTDQLGHYAEACQKKQNDLCTRWLERFGTVFSKKSDQFEQISKFFPSVPERPKSVRAPRLTTTYKGPDLDQTAFDTAMKLYLDEKHDQAAKGFGQFLDDFPRSAHRFRAQFWLGQSLAVLKEKEKAQKAQQALERDTPTSYYGLLASFAKAAAPSGLAGLDRDLSPTVALDFSDSSIDSELNIQELYHLNRAKNFLAEKSPELASFELKEIRPRDSQSLAALTFFMYLNHKARNHVTAFQFVSEMIQRGEMNLPLQTLLKVIFPIEYLELIDQYSQGQGLDPLLVLSLIKQESGFQTNAFSSSGALGLMQLMYFTALDTEASVPIEDLDEPENNIRVGTKYLSKLLVRYKGNIVLSLAAYNAGPAAVDRWLKDFPAKYGMLEFVELIPYRETREYVSGIVRNYFWYSRILKNQPLKDFQYFWNSTYLIQKTPTKRQNGNA